MNSKEKIVFLDDGVYKVLFGTILSEDNFFFNIVTKDGVHFRISKNAIVSIKEVSRDFK